MDNGERSIAKAETIMGSDEMSESVCEIARALSVVGDRWTLLIMREIGMGMRKFEEIQAQTGMSSHLLSTRLKRMEQEGLVELKLYSDRPPRNEYHATQKGKELDSVLLTMRAWTMRWGAYEPGAGPAFELTDKKTGKKIGPGWHSPVTSRPFTFSDVNASISDAFVAEREAKRLAFQQAKQRNRPVKKAAKTSARKKI
jgi:DNA-binding HxlR family transcriptional regulator